MGSSDLDNLLQAEDYKGISTLARKRMARVIRYLSGRLYTDDAEQKWRVVRALGQIVGDPEVFTEAKVIDLLNRFFWSLNDESGAVPFGIPEAIGEILALRPMQQAQYLPVLCSMVTHEDMVQTGAIERGVIWALGRVGAPVAACSRQAVQGLTALAANHDDPATRQEAGSALARIKPSRLQNLE